MPYKDKQKRYEAIRKSVAKKPEHYRLLGLMNKRRATCQRGYHIKRRYGVTLEMYNEMLVAQGNACLLCRREAGITISGRCNLGVDHDHVTGKIRGLLCTRCNTWVGHWEQPDGKDLMRKIEVYLADNS